MKKTVSLIFSLLLLFTISMQSSVRAEERSFDIKRVHIDVTIDERGIMKVAELSTYQFDGVFGGTERSILADVSNFHAYEVPNGVDDPTISIESLDELHVEHEEDLFRVHLPAEHEQKQVLYTYELANEIVKYTDVADLIYDFYPSSNNNDLGELVIQWTFDQSLSMDDVYAFVRGDGEANVQVSNAGVIYVHEFFRAGMSAEVRIIFPAESVAALPLKNDSLMEEKLVNEEQMKIDKRYMYADRLKEVQPSVYIALILLIAGFIWWYRIHPNVYRFGRHEDPKKELFFLENSDPLFISYLQVQGYVSALQLGLISTLLSLKRRKIISMKEVPSKVKKEKMTYLFTWEDHSANVDEVDMYVRNWLFEKSGEESEQFLFESILIDEGETTSVKKEKSEQFINHYSEWTRLLKNRNAFTGWYDPYSVYSYGSILCTIIVYVLFYYVLSISPMSTGLHIWLVGGVGVFAVAALIWNKNKWVVSLLYTVLLPTLFITSMWSMYLLPIGLFIVTSWFGLLMISSKKWAPEVAKLIRLIHLATRLFKRKEYPIDEDPLINERRLETAIALGVGQPYAEQIGKHVAVEKWNSLHTPLLQNPTFAGTVFHPTHMVFYSTMSSTAIGTTSSSPTSGSGGAGAF